MKKLFAILSLTCVLVFSLGSFFIYKVYLRSYKKEFRSFINSQNQDQLITYSVPKNELYISSENMTWEDDNKEVIIHGKLFDVVKTMNLHDQVILSLLPDVRELQLKKEFAELYNDSTKNSSPFMNLLKQMLSLKFVNCVFFFQSSELSSDLSYVEFDFSIPEGIYTCPFIPPSFS